ncbi:unnamed protein product [Effrenium voratum]|uniref:Uncharacterized protein n=1 Tax=Effrenium voratum TaxID=2562239 RepID=A0AA36N3X6_9DINO|nr:unnamed protein product [Effrenium voratum]
MEERATQLQLKTQELDDAYAAGRREMQSAIAAKASQEERGRELEACLRKSRTECDTLQAQSRAHEREMAFAEAQLQDLQQNHRELQVRHDRLRSQQAQLEHALQARDAEKTSAEELAAALRLQVRDQESQWQRSESEMSALRFAASQHQERSTELEATVCKLRLEKEDLRALQESNDSRNASLEAEVEHLLHARGKLQNEQGQLEYDVKCTKQELLVVRQERLVMEERATQLQLKTQELDDAHAAGRREMQSAIAAKASQEERGREQEACLRKSRTECDTLQAQSRAHEREMAFAEAQLQDLQRLRLKNWPRR